eukprot:GHVQ01002318.1.p2 GENE.GHVQ01002318.1~~GHVQ01002318.1.p2  ORF type:complete len:162 (+),score=29.16 GHVQ01002318.1:100-585(+)
MDRKTKNVSDASKQVICEAQQTPADEIKYPQTPLPPCHPEPSICQSLIENVHLNGSESSEDSCSSPLVGRNPLPPVIPGRGEDQFVGRIRCERTTMEAQQIKNVPIKGKDEIKSAAVLKGQAVVAHRQEKTKLKEQNVALKDTLETTQKLLEVCPLANNDV